MTQPGVVMGTIQYMSPEQALGKDADHRSDLFSAGVVLDGMVTGRLPFKGATPTETITEIVRSEPVPISEISPVSPPELERIIRKVHGKVRRAPLPTPAISRSISTTSNATPIPAWPW